MDLFQQIHETGDGQILASFCTYSQITKALFALFSLHTVDGKSPATPHGMYKNL